MGVPPTLAAAAALGSDSMPLLEAISGIFGSVSMASWIFLMVRTNFFTSHSNPGTDRR